MGKSCEDPGPPLRIVLGAFNDSTSVPSKQKNDGPTTRPSSSSSVHPSTPPATYILGTSYFATPRVGTVGNSSTRRSVLKLNKDGRVPMEDRKGPFDHFKPRALMLSTVRVSTINISTMMSTFFSDQLKSEQHVEELVDSGDITQREADRMNEEWENREWELRTKALPKKVGWAILRFHACTALMRFYELIMARYVLRVDVGSSSLEGGASTPTTHSSSGMSHGQAVTIMDKLTRDPFQASKRTAQLLHNQEHSPGKVISSNGTETSTSRELAKRMWGTCIWANIIPFLAELTVQQGVLFYGYGVYYMAKNRRQKAREQAQNDDGDAAADSDQCNEEGDAEVDETAYALSLMFRSSRLTIAKSMSWIAASAGGAVGSVIYPGWGTVFGNQIGDTCVGALID